MKYIVLLCDGMADEPVPELGGKTPMDVAHKPNTDSLAGTPGTLLGTAKTVQDGMNPGSDVANLSVLGYDPEQCYTGRSPLEAGSIGIDMKDTDVSLRCNLVTLSPYDGEYDDKIMEDYCAGDISTEEAGVLIKFIDENLGKPPFKFYTGVSYRHCLIWDNGAADLGKLTPPHNITDKPVRDSISVSASAAGEKAAVLISLMRRSYELLKDHSVNLRRMKEGKRPANSIWLWGEGTRAKLEPFKKKTGLNGAMISAVDLLKGIGKFAEMEVINVKGATAYLDTDFEGKADAAVNALRNNDFVYIHIEAPDECGHRGEVGGKVKSIELIDERVLGRLLRALKGTDFRILICPDHPTPLTTKTHTNAPVPYLIYDSGNEITGNKICFNEENAKRGEYIEKGYELINRLIMCSP